MGTGIEPGSDTDANSYDDLVSQQREALQESIDATAEVLLGESYEQVRECLLNQLASRDVTMLEAEVDDLAIAISQGEQPVFRAGFVEEIRIHDPAGDEHDHRANPASRTWWQRVLGKPAPSERYIVDQAACPCHGDWPQGLDSRQADLNTGMYVGWLLSRDLFREGAFQSDQRRDLLQRLRNRETTGPEIYAQCFGGVLAAAMLTDEGRRFTRDYFDVDTGPFPKDYEGLRGHAVPDLHSVQDSWSDFDRLSRVLDQRYRQWQMMQHRRFSLSRRWGRIPA